MKKIVLIGDSIMYGAKGVNGYGYYVKKNLENVAEVVLPFDNCQDVRYTYKEILNNVYRTNILF